MKKILFSLIFVAFTLSSTAQWYTRKYGVSGINELSREQVMLALEQANSLLRTGKTLTWFGLVSTGVGGIIIMMGFSDVFSFTEEGLIGGGNSIFAGGLLMSVGSLAAYIGIPLWIIGKSRKNVMEIAIVKFSPTTYLGTHSFSTPGIGIRINF